MYTLATANAPPRIATPLYLDVAFLLACSRSNAWTYDICCGINMRRT